MANITVGQDQLQVTEPQRQLASRQPLDLTSTFSTIAKTFGGTQAAIAKRKEDQRKFEANRSAQEIILNNEEEYTGFRDQLIAAGNWNQENAYKLKNAVRANLRKEMIAAGAVNKDLVAHAESQLSKIFVSDEWKVEDASIYFKKVTSPNGDVSVQPKSNDETFANLLMDGSKNNPGVYRDIAHAALQGTVMDSEGNVVIDSKRATELLLSVKEADEALERQKQNIQQQTALLGQRTAELNLIESGAKIVKPMQDSALLARADAIATSMWANFDPANTNEDQLTIQIANELKKSLNSESFNSFDSSSKEGQSINNILRAESLKQVNDIASAYAKRIYNSRVLDPETVKNQKQINAVINTARLYGSDAVVNNPVVKTLEKNAIITRSGSLIGLSATSFDNDKADIVATITKGEDIRNLGDLALWRINNAQNTSTITDNEVTLRAANAGSPAFDSSLQNIFNIVSGYINDTLDKTNMVDPGNAYVAAELALRNPKVRDHLAMNPKYTPNDINIIMGSLTDASAKAKLALQEQDRQTGFNRLESVTNFIDTAVKASFKNPIPEEQINRTPQETYPSSGNNEIDRGYGKRPDGTQKGRGYFGELKRPDGSISTEISIGVNLNGQEMEIPTLVPGLSKQQIDSLLKGEPITRDIIDIAVEHARKRLSEGKSPFAGRNDRVQGIQ